MGGAELVIHYSDAAGHRDSCAYRGLRLENPVRIVLLDYDTAASRDNQLRLWNALHAELVGPLGAEALPASGTVIDFEPASGEPTLEDLLVLVGDEQSIPSARAVAIAGRWQEAYSDNAILPLLPRAARSATARLVPPSAQAANAAFWMHHPREMLPSLNARAGITTQQPRLFISYRQVDSAALAVQLFDALSHKGFDVFLDHFRIPPGANFQARLTQELGDKSMVLVLESERLGESQWVAHEISVAKSCGLGLLALLLPRGKAQGSIDQGYRQTVAETDFVGGRFDAEATLAADALEQVVAEIMAGHDRTFVARRRMLELSFVGALRREKCSKVQRLANGVIDVRGGGRQYRVWLTPRPPAMPDFHRAHGAVAAPEVGLVIGLSRLMEPARQLQTTWLAGLCQLKLVDEGQMLQVAKAIATGRL